MTSPFPDLQSLSTRWCLFAQMMIAFARQATLLEYSGAAAAQHKAEQVEVMARLALTELVHDHAKVYNLPKSDARDAALSGLNLAAEALAVVRAVALNVMRERAAKSRMIGYMALAFEIAVDEVPIICVLDVAAIDSS